MVSIVCSRRAVRRQTLANRATLEVRAVSTGIFGVPYVVSESCTVYFLDHFSCEAEDKDRLKPCHRRPMRRSSRLLLVIVARVANASMTVKSDLSGTDYFSIYSTSRRNPVKLGQIRSTPRERPK